MASATVQAIIETTPAPTILRQVDESAILAVWEQGKRHNIELGRLLYEYGEKYGAQGSAGNGLAQFLRKHSINEGVAYYWIGVYKASVGQGVPCPHCTDTFPSKTQLKKHQSKSHSEERKPAQSVPNAGVVQVDSATSREMPLAPLEVKSEYATMNSWFPSRTGEPHGVRQRKADDRTQSGESEISEWVVTHPNSFRAGSEKPAVVRSFSNQAQAIAWAARANEITIPVEPVVHTYPQEDYEPTQQTKAASSRTHGMGLDRLRKLAKECNAPCSISHDGHNFWIDGTCCPTEKLARQFIQPAGAVRYTEEELTRSERKAGNESRLKPLFQDCGFHYYVRQNCATNEPHFDVVFSAISEDDVVKLAKIIEAGIEALKA